MSTEMPSYRPDNIEIVGRSGRDDDDDLWVDVPRDQRLAWLRVASRCWPFYPGAAVGGLTARALSEGHLVRSESLIRVARNAFDAGFTPDEYAELRRVIRARVPDHLVVKRDNRSQHADDFFEIDAHQWRDWLDRVRAGEDGALTATRMLRERPPQPASIPASNAVPIQTTEGVPQRFGLSDSALGAWGIPLSSLGGRDNRFGWWRVLEVFPPVRGVQRTGTGKYAAREAGDAWEAALNGIVDGLEAAGFTAQDYYILCLTLERLTDDQWARVDKRLFVGDGVHTRERWLVAPLSARWSKWPQLVHEKGMLPHEATEHVLGGVWEKPL